jgi:hypothetical protein
MVFSNYNHSHAKAVADSGKTLGEVHVGASLDFIEQDIHRERLSILWMTVPNPKHRSRFKH